MKKETIEIERDLLMELYDFMSSKLIHPHGQDVYASKETQQEGSTIRERVHTHHYHRANMVQTLEHNWFHRLGVILGLHKYEVVNK